MSVTVEQLPSGRHGLPREFVLGTQRRRLLAAARRAVDELGFERTTVSEIIARAGVSRKTFYERFENVEECFGAAFDDWLRDRVPALTDDPSVALLAAAQRVGYESGALVPVLRGAPARTAGQLVDVLAAAGWRLVRDEAGE